jgi:uncharacterized protein (DUF1697 family)
LAFFVCSVLLNEGMAGQYIALLRGINVGGRAKLPMARLREICEAVGCTDVSTYVQSGNVVLRSTMGAAKLASTLEDAIEAAVGFQPRVIIRKRGDLVKVVDANPYPDTEPRYLHVGFLSARPTAKAVADLADIDCSPEGFTITGKEIYLNYVNGAGQSKKLGRVPFEKKLGVSMTARNLRTITKLISLSSA